MTHLQSLMATMMMMRTLTPTLHLAVIVTKCVHDVDLLGIASEDPTFFYPPTFFEFLSIDG